MKGDARAEVEYRLRQDDYAIREHDHWAWFNDGRRISDAEMAVYWEMRGSGDA